LLMAVAGIYVVALWLVERRLDIRPLVYSGLGIAAGLIINPYFPHNLVFIVQHILPKLTETTALSVGNEWFPYNTGQLLENSPLALLAFIGGALALGFAHRRMDTRTTTAYLLAILFGLMLFQSRRFIEYFPPFALIFAAFAWTPILRRAQTTDDETEPSIRRIRQVLALALVVVLLFAGTRSTLARAQDSLRASRPYGMYAGSAAWLEANTPPGSRVFQTDWDDFPRLFYYNTHNTYLVGLDPTYMQQYDPDLYERWVDITRGRVPRPSEAIRSEFGARYVMSDLLHGSFLELADEDPRLIEVYRDGDSVVFEVE
jgi:hypothetical protein